MSDTAQHLIILGDSLTQPRSWVGLGVRDTYAYRLQAEFAPALAVSNLGMPENNTRTQTGDFSAKRTFVKAEADYVVVQLGIVDCAPRLLFTPERLAIAALRRIPVVKWPADFYLKFRSRYRKLFTKHVRIVMVPLAEFERNFEVLIRMLRESNPVKRIYLVNIAYPGPHMIDRSHDVLGNIEPYNNVIHALAQREPDLIRLVDVFAYTRANPDGLTADDGHHLTQQSHRFIADQIADDLKAYIGRF